MISIPVWAVLLWAVVVAVTASFLPWRRAGLLLIVSVTVLYASAAISMWMVQ